MTTDKKLPLHNNNNYYNNCNEKTKESSPMFTISSFSPDSTAQSLSTNTISKSSLRRIGTIKIIILAIVTPIMILTIVNPMWICIFMKYPHVNRHISTKTPVRVEFPHTSHNINNVHNNEIKPQAHTRTKLYKGGIKVTQETLDVIVASKDGHRLEELETTITVIENIPPSSNNHRHHKQTSHDNNKKETNNFKAHVQTHKPLVTSNNDKSILDGFRERIFRDRNSCAYVALSVITLCAVTICGIVCLSSDNRKTYESVNNDDENQGDHYVRVEDCDDDEKLNENNVTENKTDSCVIIDCARVQITDNDNISTPTSSPPPYSSSNTNHEVIPTSNSYENIQQ